MAKLNSVDELKKLRNKLKDETFKPDKVRARVCCGTACTATGAHKIIDSFEKEAAKTGVDLEIVKDRMPGDMPERPN